MDFWRAARPWLIALLVLAVLAGGFVTRMHATLPWQLTWPASELFAPVGRGLSRVSDWIGGTVRLWREIGQLRSENERLRAELASQPLLAVEVTELRDENEQLRRLLAMQERLSTRVQLQAVGAQVIGRSPSAWFSLVKIDAGSAQGISPGDAVVSDRGLVGRVQRVSAHSSDVLLITDVTNSVGATVQRSHSRAQGVVLADGRGGLTMRLFSTYADVAKGDLIVTSSLSELYPEGLPVGSVTEVAPSADGLLLEAQVRPAADMMRLEEVLVLRGGP